MWNEISGSNHRVDQAFEKFLDYTDEIQSEFNEEMEILEASFDDRHLKLRDALGDLFMAIAITLKIPPKKLAQAFYPADKLHEYKEDLTNELLTILVKHEKEKEGK